MMQAARRLHRGRKFRDRDAIADGIADVFPGGIVVARKRNAVTMRQRDDLAHVGRRIGLLIGSPLFKEFIEFGVGLAGTFAAIVVAQLAFVSKLALPRL